MGSEVGDRPSYDELLGIVRGLQARVAQLEQAVATHDRRIAALEAENRKLRGLLDVATRGAVRRFQNQLRNHQDQILLTFLRREEPPGA